MRESLFTPGFAPYHCKVSYPLGRKPGAPPPRGTTALISSKSGCFAQVFTTTKYIQKRRKPNSPSVKPTARSPRIGARVRNTSSALFPGTPPTNMTGLAALDMDSRLDSRRARIPRQFFIHAEAYSTVAHDTPEAKISPAIR